MSAKVTCHVSVHVTKAIQSSKREVKDETTNDSKNATYLAVPHFICQHCCKRVLCAVFSRHICKYIDPYELETNKSRVKNVSEIILN